jgi:hypothetical protein
MHHLPARKKEIKGFYIPIGAQGRGEGRSGKLAIDLGEEEGGAGKARCRFRREGRSLGCAL